MTSPVKPVMRRAPQERADSGHPSQNGSRPPRRDPRKRLDRRLLRVLRRLAFTAAIGVTYYFVSSALMHRYGHRGFLYALILLAVFMALLAEFGSDITALPKRARAALRRARAERERRAATTPADASKSPDREQPTAAPDAAPVPSAPPPEPATREDAEALLHEQLGRVQSGQSTDADLQHFLQTFYFIDGFGKFWTMRPDSEKWVFYKGGQWRPGVPVGRLTKAKVAKAA